MTTLALAANVATIGGHVADMVKAFVYPLIKHIRSRTRRSDVAVDPLVLARELGQCQQNLVVMLDFLDCMAKEGMQSSKECERMRELLSKHSVLDSAVSTPLVGMYKGNSASQLDPTCLDDIQKLVHEVRLFQSEVQMFSNEKRRGKIVNLIQIPSWLPGIEDVEKARGSTQVSLGLDDKSSRVPVTGPTILDHTTNGQSESPAEASVSHSSAFLSSPAIFPDVPVDYGGDQVAIDQASELPIPEKFNLVELVLPHDPAVNGL